MAISFGHKDNKWRSKYSFSAKSMMSSVKNFLSKGASTEVHKHNEGAVNSFYGTTHSSLLGVAFNDNPSSNKVFKSMSIEGSESLKNKTHDFAPATATESPSNNKYYGTKPAKNMGGLLYNNFSNSDKVVPGVSMHYLGEVEDITDFFLTYQDGTEELIDTAFNVDIDTSYSSYSPLNSSTSDVKYGFYFPDEGKFYFGSELPTTDDDDDDDDDDDTTIDPIDNCDILQLYSTEQLYQTVFYPDVGYIYVYTPNSVAVGTQTDVDVSVIRLGIAGQELTSADQVTEDDPYYDPDRWAWRFPLSSAGNYAIRANSYAGEFISLDGNYVDDYQSQVCEPGGYDFGQIFIYQDDINQTLLCPQLEAASSYSISEDPNSQGLEGFGVVTINIAGGILQDEDFSFGNSNAYLVSSNQGFGESFTVLEPSSITYDSSSGTEIVFQGVPPNTPDNPFWSFRFNNVGCNETFISWSDGSIFIPPPGSENVCDVILNSLEEAALASIGNPDSAPIDNVQGSGSFQGIVEPTFDQPQFRFILNSDFPEFLVQVLLDNGLEQGLIPEYLGQIGGASLGESIRMTAVRLDDATNALTEDVYNLGQSSLIPIVGIVFDDNEFVYGANNSVSITEPGNYAVFLSIATCSSSSDDYGIRVSTDYYPGPPLGDCTQVFSNNSNPYHKFEFASTVSSVSVSGENDQTKGSITFNLAYLEPSLFDLSEFVFFLSGQSLTSTDAETRLPHVDDSVSINYVQDGGQNFENDNDISTTWQYLGNALGQMKVVVSNIPLSPDFNIEDPDTYSTFYSWGFLSKTCFNDQGPNVDSYDGDFYLSDTLWSDTYGVNGSVVLDSQSQVAGGAIQVTANVTVDSGDPPDLDSPTFEPDFNNQSVIQALADNNQDGEIGSADLLEFLAVFGTAVPDQPTSPPNNAVYNEFGQYYVAQGDLNNDGAVGSSDLLSLLTVFGQSVDLEGSGLYYDDPTQARLPSGRASDATLVDLASTNYSLSNIPASISDAFASAYTRTSPTKASISMASLNEDITTYVKSEDFPSNAQLFAFVDPILSGDELRGQTAELLLDLGSDDFELFAVNLNYELLNADHTK